MFVTLVCMRMRRLLQWRISERSELFCKSGLLQFFFSNLVYCIVEVLFDMKMVKDNQGVWGILFSRGYKTLGPVTRYGLYLLAFFRTCLFVKLVQNRPASVLVVIEVNLYTWSVNRLVNLLRIQPNSSTRILSSSEQHTFLLRT